MDDDELEPWEDDGADFPDEAGFPDEEGAGRSLEDPDDEGAGAMQRTDGDGLFGAPAPVQGEGAAAPLALYRRYRPDTFSEVIGQEHVTRPLQRALENNRVNHAYLFSGPRGCGKTTSARILARALNCENGPAAEPCGHCQSCRDLATGGPGSIDVIEIDAASHGGVDDARELREKAFFAPVSSRYKIYIIDEAHMVTTQGFNALLKLVEEPPPHVKFIFATTEPDKVIGTIRSRTHHYPFRLVPPRVLNDYLARICTEEGIATEPGVLPLVVRAGGGSVRDSLSVLDQLLGGASPEGVTYEHATSLLGYTPDELLDTMVDAFAAGDGSGVFSVVERVIEAGQDPRRFAEDLLGRLRDLVIVAAVPDALATGLVEVTPGQAETYAKEAAAMGLGELTRAADVIADGMTQMRGTTAPRLHLELMCARVLLPGADVADRGVNARLDRIERRLNLGGLDTGVPVGDVPGDTTQAPAPGQRLRGSRRDQQAPAAPAAPGQPPAPVQEPAAVATTPAPEPAAQTPAPAAVAPTGPASVRPPRPSRPQAPVADHQQGAAPTPQPAHPRGEQPQQVPVAQAPVPPVPAEQGPPRSGVEAGGPKALTTQDAQERWPDLLAAVGRRRNFTKVLLEGNAALVSLVGGVLTLALGSPGARASFERPRERQAFMEAVTEVFGGTLQVDTVIDPDAGRQGRGGRSGSPSGPGGSGGPGGRAPGGRPAGGPAPTTGLPPARPSGPPVGGGSRAMAPSAPAPASVTAPSSVATAAPAPSGPAGPVAPAATPRLRGTRRGTGPAQPAPPSYEDVPPPPEPPEDPWDEPPPEEDPYVPQQMDAPAAPQASASVAPAPRVAPVPSAAPAPASGASASAPPEAPSVAGPRTPRPTGRPTAQGAAAAPDVRASTGGGAEVATLRPSRYSKIAAAPRPVEEPTPEEEASAYSDEDDTVGEGYESAAELLTNVLGAELILEEAQEGESA